MKNDVFWTRVIYIISIVVSLLVAFLILGPRPQGIEGTLDVSFLPFVNATLNSITTLLLIYGYYLILNRRVDAHKNVMLTCFGTSTLFLVSYVVYHWYKSGPKMYVGDYKTTYNMVVRFNYWSSYLLNVILNDLLVLKSFHHIFYLF